MAGFAVLMRERADVLGIALQQGDDYLVGWTSLIDAGLARLLLAEHDGELVGGLFLFRQGGIHATAYSADRAARATTTCPARCTWCAGRPSATRWQRAVRPSSSVAWTCPATAEPPQKGDPNRGLYEHKRGFGAVWVEREPARRIVLRPDADGLARVRRRAIDALRGMRR